MPLITNTPYKVPPFSVSQQVMLTGDSNCTTGFGRFIEMTPDGNFVVVADPNYNSNRGRVHVFEKTGGSPLWEERTAFGVGGSQSFGRGLSISSDASVIAVGATQATGAASGSGAVYVYHKTSPTSWTQVDKLFAPDGASGDEVNACTVSGDGNTIAIGGQHHDHGGIGTNSGQMNIFEREPGSPMDYTHRGEYLNSDAEAQQRLGEDLHMPSDGNSIAVCAYSKPDGNPNGGAVYILERNPGSPTTFSEAYKILPNDAGGSPDPRINWGRWTHFSGDGTTLGVSGDYMDSGGISGVGFAYIFRKGAGSPEWTQEAKITSPDQIAMAYFGTQVILNNDGTVALITQRNNTVSVDEQAFVYVYDNGSWIPGQTFTYPTGVTFGAFGRYGAMNSTGSTLAIVSDRQPGGINRGAVWIYE